MKLEHNVKTDRSIVEYRYKYKHRKQVLKKYTTKEVNDYDKENAISVYKGEKVVCQDKHLLLKGRKWWLIDGVYYQVPRPLSLCWFRNWSKGAKITGYTALGLVLALCIGGHFCVKAMLRPCADIAFDSNVGDKAAITNLHFDENHDLICNLTPKNDSFIIYKIDVKKGDTPLLEDQNYTFTYGPTYQLRINYLTMNNVEGKIVVTPTFDRPETVKF